MKVCITGASGFIGSNLTEACLKRGYSVVGIDNLSTGDRNLSDPFRYGRFKDKYSFVLEDIRNISKIKTVFGGCDVVFHLAALPRVSFSVDHPIESNDVNVNGTLCVLQAASEVGVKRVIFSCSSSIFGGEADFPTKEDAKPSPKSPYAAQKEMGATYCRLYSELYGLDTCSLIYYNVFGKHQKAGSSYATVIPAFFDAAVNGTSCRIDGDGNQSRDFAYIDNVVQANILAAEYSGKLDGERFNIACGESNSVNDVYNVICYIFGKTVNKHNAPTRLGDPRKSLADITKAKKILGYEPKIKFEEGMEKTAEWWRHGCLIKKM